MSEEIIIFGSSGHAKVVADIVRACGETLIGFPDDNKTIEILGYPIRAKITDAGRYSENCAFIIGIGSNRTRKKTADAYPLKWYPAIHQTVAIGRDVHISEGTAVIRKFIKQLLKDEQPTINGDGRQSRDFTYIDNVIEPKLGPGRAGDIKHSNVDISKAKKLLGYESEYDFAKGLNEAIAWYKEELS